MLTFFAKHINIYIKVKKDVDKMFQIIMKLIGVLMLLAGIVMIYDARILTKKFFGFGDQNEASNGLKILGLIVSVLGGLIVYFNL